MPSWTCMADAFSRALGVKPEDIYQFLGHDGGEIVAPSLPDPFSRRGFHVQEMIDFCASCGRAVMEFQRWPALAYPQAGDLIKEILTKDQAERRWQSILSRYNGVIEGVRENHKKHAVAYSCNTIYDSALPQPLNYTEWVSVTKYLPFVLYAII